jgi:hypothetical protein
LTTAIDDLADLLDAAGAIVTCDGRRYARAAAAWPDCLPPMFGREAVAVEYWGMNARYVMWETRRPELWPAPTVAVGELWEQKSALIDTWEASRFALHWFKNVQHRVVRIDGECFLNEHGYHVPWGAIPGPHWRRIEAAP